MSWLWLENAWKQPIRYCQDTQLLGTWSFSTRFTIASEFLTVYSRLFFWIFVWKPQLGKNLSCRLLRVDLACVVDILFRYLLEKLESPKYNLSPSAALPRKTKLIQRSKIVTEWDLCSLFSESFSTTMIRRVSRVISKSDRNALCLKYFSFNTSLLSVFTLEKPRWW